MISDPVFASIVAAIAGGPAVSFLALATLWMLGPVPGERPVRAMVLAGNAVSLAAALGVGTIVALGLHAPGAVHAGSWFATREYSFDVVFLVDTTSIVMSILVAAVTGLIGHFSTRYLHAQSGFTRFFLLLALFASGMSLLVTAANVDLLFAGWELVGISSALLVGYFHQRRTPVEASLRVFVTYRLCDLGLLVGAVLLHQAAGTTDLASAPSAMRSHGHLGDAITTLVPLALLFAAMGKSAQLPVGGWLPRAMEGPTPSSALFYGALSVHAGVYLLLRAAPLFAASSIATASVIAVGAATAIHASLIARVQTDAKSTLAYATMTQVGLMLVEIGLGLTSLALVHVVAHALLRCFQLLRVPSALRDAIALQSSGIPAAEPASSGGLPAWMAAPLYRIALERFGLEPLFDRALVRPVLALGQALDRTERRWVVAIAGDPGTDPAAPIPAAVDR